MLKNGIFCEMVILVVFKVFYWLKIWKFWSKSSQIAPFVTTPLNYTN